MPETKFILGKRGKRSISQISSGERGVTTTLIAAMNPNGHFIPPLIVYKGKRLRDDVKTGFPEGSCIIANESGYSDKETFQLWLKNFQKYRLNPSRDVLLIIDGHTSHSKNLEALEYARKNLIHILCLPPHSTHVLQPLDKSFFKSMKVNFQEACRKFMQQHPGRAITRSDFPELFTYSYNKSANATIAANGFMRTGIYPLNVEAIPEEAYEPSMTFDDKALSTTPNSDTDSESVPPLIDRVTNINNMEDNSEVYETQVSFTTYCSKQFACN